MPSGSSSTKPPPQRKAKTDSERLLEFCAAVPENSNQRSESEGGLCDERGRLNDERAPLLPRESRFKGKKSAQHPSLGAMALNGSPNVANDIQPLPPYTSTDGTNAPAGEPKKGDDWNVSARDVSEGDSSENGKVTDAGAPEMIGGDGGQAAGEKQPWWKKHAAYICTKQFWLVLVIGQVLALCITATNTFSGLLAGKGTSIPAFQSFFNYFLLNLVYTSWTIHKYGFKKWGSVVLKDGWRFFILAFMDVEGNYFVVLAYRYTTILSAQLINFWAIVVVVVISLIFLRVRYHLAQYLGIFICVGGMGLLLASDHITGSNGGQAVDALKGDLFALLGATFYGLSNCFEEFLVSKRPLYEVVGQLAFWAMLINGTQAGIFDRTSFREATWDGQVAGYIVGYTLMLFIFYSLTPIFFRLTSAAFFNISLLTGNFWGVCIGVEVFHLSIHWMYPIAFVLIMLGHFAYYLTEGVLGEAKKPWLSEDQSDGVSGVGTAKRRLERPEVIV